MNNKMVKFDKGQAADPRLLTDLEEALAPGTIGPTQPTNTDEFWYNTNDGILYKYNTASGRRLSDNVYVIQYGPQQTSSPGTGAGGASVMLINDGLGLQTDMRFFEHNIAITRFTTNVKLSTAPQTFDFIIRVQNTNVNTISVDTSTSNEYVYEAIQGSPHIIVGGSTLEILVDGANALGHMVYLYYRKAI